MWIHVVISVDGRLIWKRILCLVITAIQDSSDFSRRGTSIVILKILEIMRNPPAIHKEANFFSLLIQVSEERSDYFDSFLAITHLFNLNLFVVIEDTSHLNFFE